MRGIRDQVSGGRGWRVCRWSIVGRVFLVIPAVAVLVGCGGNGAAPTAKPAVTLAVQAPSVRASQTPAPLLTPDAPNTSDSSAPLSGISTTAAALPKFVQLTSGGCCVQPFFSPDDTQALFIDKSSPDATTGIYGVPLSQPLSTPTLFTPLLGPFSRDMSLAVDLIGGKTTLQKRTGDAPPWVINNGGRVISFSPDNTLIAWNVSQDSGNFDVRRSEVWIANLDGSAARRVLVRYGGGIQGWMDDSQRFLVGGKANRNDPTTTLSIFDLRDNSLRDVYSADRMRGFNLSPDGNWLVFFIAQSRQSDMNGMYLLDLKTPNAQPKRQDWFGAYRWRNNTQLLYVPLISGAPSSELRQLNIETGATEVLLPASADSPFKIGNGDWDTSRDGRHLLFVSARDRNIWLLNL